MARPKEQSHVIFLVIIALLSWLIPGSGYFCLKEKKRAILVFVTITLTFGIGLYIGSVGVIDPIGAKPWFVAQMMNSPVVMALGKITEGGAWPVYGKPNEIGQIYTSISGLLNLLCIVNIVYFAYTRSLKTDGD